MSREATPRVRGNDWGLLGAPEAGAYTPTRPVSIVVPAYQAQATLPYTLAALAGQTYPSHLLEVVVVDDDGAAPLELPDLRPEHTRVVTAPASWGRANACGAGAAAASGEVLHWLDADMVPHRDHVLQHMRWHHASDEVVVLGHKLFLDSSDLPTPQEVGAAVADGRVEELLAGRPVSEHQWVEEIWRRTDDLRTAGFRAFHVHVGATASVGRELYGDAGGMDPDLKLGEDIELGYRLAMKGAVFVPERAATSWHLGRSHLMSYEAQVQRYNAPFIAQRVPDFRKFRQGAGRSYRVPYLEVVVPTAGHTCEEVRFTVDGVLAARPGDLRCLLVGPWSRLDEERRHPLRDPLLEHRLLQEEYGTDARVALVDEVEPTAFPTQFRVHLPAGWRPAEGTFDALTKDMQKRALGLRSSLLPDGRVVRLERTAAFERALRVARPGEDLEDVVDDVSGTWWSDGVGDGFEHQDALAHRDPGPPPGPGRGGRPDAPTTHPTRPAGAPGSPESRRRFRPLPRALGRRSPSDRP